MYIEGKYLLVSYRDIPNTDFICEYEGDIRIKVSKIEKSALPAPGHSFSGAAEKWILIFENISNKLIQEQDELLQAVQWYKSKIGLRAMSVIYV